MYDITSNPSALIVQLTASAVNNAKLDFTTGNDTNRGFRCLYGSGAVIFRLRSSFHFFASPRKILFEAFVIAQEECTSSNRVQTYVFSLPHPACRDLAPVTVGSKCAWRLISAGLNGVLYHNIGFPKYCGKLLKHLQNSPL